MAKKRVLIVGPAWPLRGGLATYDERLCREFINLGFECEILSFSLQYPKILFPGKTQFSDDPKPLDITIHSAVNSINPLNWLITGRRFSKKNYDYVVFRYWMSFMGPAFGTIARLLKRNSKTRILAITDNIVPHEKKFFDKPFTNYFLNSIDGFLSMSKEVFQQVEELQPNKPRVYVPHPVYDMFGEPVSKEIAVLKLGLDPTFNYCLFFGFIRKYKGLSLLLESFAKVNRAKHKLKLIIAGEFYEDSAPYLQQIKDLGLENDIILRTDFIPNEMVGTYFCASSLVAQTYISATQSGVTQIAYYYNKPMLVTNVGGLAELVPDGKAGIVCEVDSDEIAFRWNNYFDKDLENQMSEAILEEKKRFTWSYLANQLLSL
jgi:glycosyltransferase involved in cell wall biosynthesis